MNSAEFSFKSHCSSTMSLELALPGLPGEKMFINRQSDIVDIDTNRIDSNSQPQNNLKQTIEKIESFGTANLGDQIHIYQKAVSTNESKPAEKIPEPKNTRKLRLVHSRFQIDALNLEYQKNKKYITIPERREIARKLGLTEKQVKNWFQNKRTQEKRAEKKKLASKKELPPITTISSISHKHIRDNFYSSCWSEEKSPEPSGSLPTSIIPSSIISQDANTLTDDFLLPYCPQITVSSNDLYMNSSTSLPIASSGDTSSLSFQMANEPNNNINSSLCQNDFLLNMPLPSSDTTSFLPLRSSANNVSLPWVMQQVLTNPYLQYFNQWIYPFYSYWPQNQQLNIKQEKPDDFQANSLSLINEQLLSYSQRFDNQPNLDQLEQFPLDFINSYNLGNHFLNF